MNRMRTIFTRRTDRINNDTNAAGLLPKGRNVLRAATVA